MLTAVPWRVAAPGPCFPSMGPLQAPVALSVQYHYTHIKHSTAIS